LVYNSTSGSNDSSTDIRTAAFSDISISMPYNAATNDVVQEYTGNMSYFRFSSPIWSGQYVTLEISGCQATGDELGATVAEFNLFGADGASVVGSGAGANGTSTNATTSIVIPSSTRGSVSSLATASITATRTPSSPSFLASNTGFKSASRSRLWWVSTGVVIVVALL
ncbi:hypothetical protein KCU86_g23150, partial [Aureobasidium melanogenum]